MEKTQAVNYVDRRKWFAYEVFKKFKYGKEKTIQNCKKKIIEKINNQEIIIHILKKKKEEKKKESESNQSFSPIENDKAESKHDYNCLL